MRTKFKPDERDAFKPGTKVEWRNGSHWHPGTVKGDVETSLTGWQSIAVENHATTRTCHKGQIFHASPTFIRLPAEDAPTKGKCVMTAYRFRGVNSHGTQVAGCLGARRPARPR